MAPPNTRTLFASPSLDHVEQTPDTRFRAFVNAKHGLKLRSYWELHAWSIENLNDLWVAVWEFTGVVGEREELLFDASFPMDKPNPRLIRGKLNFAENILLAHSNARSTTAVALVSVIEPDASLPPTSPEWLASTFLRSLTFAQLYDEVRDLANTLKAMGVGPGDRVAAFSPSNAESVVACLATASLGGVWSSCPSEFGTNAVLERLSQISPKVLLTADSFRYAAKHVPIYPKLQTILASLPTVTDVIVVGHMHADRHPREEFPADRQGKTWTTYGDAVRAGQSAEKDIKFWRGSAMAPLYVLYSSGTTGKPKALVHTVGGMVLSSKMSNTVHNGFVANDCFLQFSTLGWMMWNYALSTLGSGVRVVMYDGSPLTPMPILWQLVDLYKVTTLGISPRYLQVLDTAKYTPNQHHSLKSLKSIAIAGSVLKAELYDWIRDSVGDHVFINNGSGGTDICNLFVGGVQSLPVYHAEIQAPALGMALESWDDDSNPVKDAQGNMVIVKPFPNAPLGFWGDDDGSRYKAAYYEEYPKTPVWYQGDWIEISSLTGGVTIFGRSDGVLNPGGVRFGSAELYAVVEEMEEVDDCIAVGQKLPDGDERVILFVKPKHHELTSEVIKRIRSGIAVALSSRHVPAKVIFTDKIPYTTNGKRLEVATKKLVNGVAFDAINLSAAEDPESLRQFINHPELSIAAPKARL